MKNRIRGATAVQHVVLVGAALLTLVGFQTFSGRVGKKTGCLGSTVEALRAGVTGNCGGSAAATPTAPLNGAGAAGKAGGTNAGSSDRVCDKDGSCSGQGNCFVAGTPVLTARGPKPIEEVAAGDVVLAMDPNEADSTMRPVIATMKRDNQPIVRIEVERQDGARDTVNTTREHPFWVEGRGWTAAAELHVDDRLRTADHAVAAVASTQSLAETRDVYNFTVDDLHTYFVGESHLLVHNACDGHALRFENMPTEAGRNIVDTFTDASKGDGAVAKLAKDVLDRAGDALPGRAKVLKDRGSKDIFGRPSFNPRPYERDDSLDVRAKALGIVIALDEMGRPDPLDAFRKGGPPRGPNGFKKLLEHATSGKNAKERKTAVKLLGAVAPRILPSGRVGDRGEEAIREAILDAAQNDPDLADEASAAAPTSPVDADVLKKMLAVGSKDWAAAVKKGSKGEGDEDFIRYAKLTALKSLPKNPAYNIDRTLLDIEIEISERNKNVQKKLTEVLTEAAKKVAEMPEHKRHLQIMASPAYAKAIALLPPEEAKKRVAEDTRIAKLGGEQLAEDAAAALTKNLVEDALAKELGPNGKALAKLVKGGGDTAKNFGKTIKIMIDASRASQGALSAAHDLNDLKLGEVKADFQARLNEARKLNAALRDKVPADQRRFIDQLEKVFEDEAKRLKDLTVEGARARRAGRLEDNGTTLAAVASLVGVGFDIYNGEAFKDGKSGLKTVVSSVKPLKDADAFVRVGQRAGESVGLLSAASKEFKAAQVYSFAAKDIEAVAKATSAAKLAGRLKVIGPVADVAMTGLEGYNTVHGYLEGDYVDAGFSGARTVFSAGSAVGGTMVLTGVGAPAGTVIVVVSNVGLIVVEVADAGRAAWNDGVVIPAEVRELGVDVTQPQGIVKEGSALPLGRRDPVKAQQEADRIQAARIEAAKQRLRKARIDE